MFKTIQTIANVSQILGLFKTGLSGVAQAAGGINFAVVKQWQELTNSFYIPKPVSTIGYKLTPNDKGLNTIVAPFLLNDSLRPKLNGICFDEHGICATDTHQLIFIPGKHTYRGIYLFPQFVKNNKASRELHKQAFKNNKHEGDPYPDYMSVIPKSSTHTFKVDILALKTFAEAVKATQLNNATINPIILQYGKSNGVFNLIALNCDKLIQVLTGVLQLHGTSCYMHISAPNRAVVFTPGKKITKSQFIILLMPLMLADDEWPQDIDFETQLQARYDVSKNQVYSGNKKYYTINTIPGKEQIVYPGNMSKGDLDLLKKNIPAKPALYVLKYVFVENNKAYVSSDTENFISVKANLPTGLYNLTKGGLMLSATNADEYPKPHKAQNNMDNLKAKKIATNKKTKPMKAAKKVLNTKKVKPLVAGKKTNPPIVRNIKSLEIQHITKYVNLNGKSKPAASVINLGKQVAKAIAGKSYNEHTGMLNEIHSKLTTAVKAIAKAGVAKVDFNIDKDFKAKLQNVLKNVKVRVQTNVLAGVTPTLPKTIKTVADVKTFFKYLTEVDNVSFHPDDDFNDTINFNTKKSTYTKAQAKLLNKLMDQAFTVCTKNKVDIYEIGFETTPIAKYSKSKAKKKSLSGVGTVDQGGVSEVKPIQTQSNPILSASQILQQSYKTNELGPYTKYFGKVAHNFDLMLHGEPGAGKTYFLLRFANWYAENIGPVLFLSDEEYGTVTLQLKIEETKSTSPNLYFVQSLKGVNISNYALVILDSITSTGLTLEDYKAMRIANPDTAVIAIFQKNKDGSFKGGKDWEHEIEICGELVFDEKNKRCIRVYRNRYGVLGKQRI
ncbi:MAG: hypothetical protein V4538_01830 [Bacteroidota bacterium]